MVWRSNSFIPLLILILIGSSVFSNLTPVSAQIVPEVSLGPLDPLETWTQVYPDSISKEYFNGTVTVSKPPAIGIVQVQLDASTSAGWTAAVSPQTIPFTESGTVDIHIEVVIPQATPATTDNPQRVHVTAIATFPGGSDQDTTEATINILQYFRISVQSVESLSKDNPAEFNLDIYNRGNGKDSVKLEISPSSTHLESILTISFETPTTPQIQMDEYATVKVVVEYDYKDVEVKKYTIYIKATSIGSQKSDKIVEVEYSIGIQVEELNIVNIIPRYGTSILGVIIFIIILISLIVVYRKMKKRRTRKGVKNKKRKKKE